MSQGGDDLHTDEGQDWAHQGRPPMPKNQLMLHVLVNTFPSDEGKARVSPAIEADRNASNATLK